MCEEIKTLLQAMTGVTGIEQRADGLWLDAPALDVVEMAHLMLAQKARLSTMTAIAIEDGETEVIYHYVLGSQAFHFKNKTVENSLPSITPVTAAADWIEREIADLYAVSFKNHPNPVRLIRPQQIEPGYFRTPAAPSGTVPGKQK